MRALIIEDEIHGCCFDIFTVVEVKTPIIFTTAFDQYALKAFKVNSIDYLLKPIDEDELVTAVKKWIIILIELKI